MSRKKLCLTPKRLTGQRRGEVILGLRVVSWEPELEAACEHLQE